MVILEGLAPMLDFLERSRVIIGTVLSLALLAIGGLLAWLDWHPPETQIVTSRELIKQSTTVVQEAKAESTTEMSAHSSLININTATVQQLDTLPGIGPAYAERIVAYRTQYGLFKNTRDVVQVKGIGEGTYNKIKDLITVGSP